jgi:hypothetical protein
MGLGALSVTGHGHISEGLLVPAHQYKQNKLLSFTAHNCHVIKGVLIP